MSSGNIDSGFVTCTNCGKRSPEGKYCSFCGAVLNEKPAALETEDANLPVAIPIANQLPVAAVLEVPAIANTSPAAAASTEQSPYKTAFIALILIAACLVLAVFYAIATAETRTVIDVESYTRGTGVYKVSNDSEDNPCYIYESWGDCINAYIAEYNAACANRNLIPDSKTLCDSYSDMIEDMESQPPGGYVGSLGSWGRLSVEELQETVPAVTHKEVCYLGFIGECE